MELISLLLSCTEVQLPQLLSTPAISSTLLQLVAHSTPSSPHRIQLHQLILHLSNIPGTLSLPLLALYSQSYAPTNEQLVQELMGRALQGDEGLSHSLLEQAPDLLQQSIQQSLQLQLPLQQLTPLLSPHLALLTSHPAIASSAGQHPTLLSSISTLYSTLSPSHDQPTLQLKLSLLEASHSFLHSAFLDPLLSPIGNGEGTLTTSERHALLEELEGVLLPLLSPNVGGGGGSGSSHSPRGRGLISATLLQDLERYFGLSKRVEEGASGLLGERRGRVKELVERVREGVKLGGGEGGGEDGLEMLRRMRSAKTEATSTQGKGKARAVSQDTPPTPAPEADALLLPLTQILDVFPDLDPAFLRACLVHDSFASGEGSAEKVIAALLEDNLPEELKRMRDGVEAEQEEEAVPAEVPAPAPAPAARRNVFDDGLPTGRMKRGKERANDLLADRTFMTESIKASIIARAERESSDEEEEYEGQYGEAFVEDEEGGRGFGVRDAGEGEEGELVVREREREGGASGTTTPAAQSGRNTPVPPPAPADPLANPFGPAVSHYLETTYLATPALFDRSSLVRRGKERKLLRERTGLGDEQIEGWRVMLERNPKKDKILAKHGVTSSSSTSSVVTTTATPQANLNHLNAAPPPSSSRGRGRGGGGGGGGGERGGAGRGGAGGRGRGDGGRAQHDRRQRGNDRKMAGSLG